MPFETCIDQTVHLIFDIRGILRLDPVNNHFDIDRIGKDIADEMRRRLVAATYQN
jgi:hypothetical protein